jgi:putative heme-binding domain-containing protein
LESDQLGEIRHGLDLAAKLATPELDRKALLLALDRDRPEPIRVTVIGAIAARLPGPIAGRLADASEPMPVREAAARGLGQLNQPDARAALVDAIAAAPSRLSAVIAEALVAAKPGAEQLCEVVERGKASPRLLADRTVRAKLETHGLKDRVERLTAGLPPADRQTEELIASRRVAVAQAPANHAAGKELFARHCGVCHQVAGQGAKIGPQLDGIGARGLDRLLEDVLDPSRNVDPAFRQTTVQLTDGRIVSGLVLREDARTLTIADAQGKEIAVDRGRIEHRAASSLSAMPANAGETLSDRDFTAVMHYLLSLTGSGSQNPGR